MAEEKTQTKNRKYIYAVGKRKSSIAKVRIYPGGKGDVIINKTELNSYANTNIIKERILSPLSLTKNTSKLDIEIMVEGGGTSSQADAIKHGISRALVELDETLRTTLKKEKFLTRDSRVKERKKFGRKKARRSPQFSKR